MAIKFAKIFLFCCCSIISACSTTPLITIHKGIVENTTNLEIKNFRLVHLPTHATLSLSGILPFNKAELGILPKALLGTQAKLSWKVSDIQYSQILNLENLSTNVQVRDYVLIYRIYAKGIATVVLSPIY